jgi:hypothetical protein
VLWATLSGGVVHAAEYYVAPDGDDAAGVERAQQAAAPGDTVWIRGGEYRFRGTSRTVGVSFTKSGTQDKPAVDASTMDRPAPDAGNSTTSAVSITKPAADGCSFRIATGQRQAPLALWLLPLSAWLFRRRRRAPSTLTRPEE